MTQQSVVGTRGDHDLIVFLNKDKEFISLQLGPKVMADLQLEKSTFPDYPPDGAVYYVIVDKIWMSLSYYMVGINKPHKLKEYEPYSRYKIVDEVKTKTPKPITDLYPNYKVPEPEPESQPTNNALVPVNTRTCEHFTAVHPSCSDKILQCEYCLYQAECPDCTRPMGIMG